MLKYFLWEMWVLGGMVLSPCHYQLFPNLFFIWFCSPQSPLPWRCLHCWKAQKVRARITHSQPTDQMADKHHEWRKAFLHKKCSKLKFNCWGAAVPSGEPGWDTGALKCRHLSKTVPRLTMCSLEWTMYSFCTCLALPDTFASPSGSWAGIDHPECNCSCQWHPCQQRHHPYPQQGMSVHVALGNAAVVAPGLCSSFCYRAKEEHKSGWLGRDIKAKYMRLSQGPDRCFLCSSVQCLKHLSPGPVGGEFPFSWLIEEFRLLQDCVKWDLLIAFLASRAGAQWDSPQPLAQPCSFGRFCCHPQQISPRALLVCRSSSALWPPSAHSRSC